MPIVIDDKEYRNLQEQVGYLTEEIKKIKQSMGEALPDPIPGPQGDPGQRGEKGETGRTPKIGFGYGPLPDTGFENGDIYIARGNGIGVTKGNLYCRVNNNWQLMLNLVGPQGPQGLDGGSQVIANPVEGYSDFLNKIDIDGVIYGIPTGNFVKYITAPESTTLTDEEIANIIDGVFIEGTFLGYKNPVLFPAGDNGSSYRGLILSTYGDAGASSIQVYSINKDSKVISSTGDRILTLSNIYSINGTFIPDFPSSPTFRKKLVYNSDNTLQWKDDKLYRHNICLEFTGDKYVYFTLFSTNGAPITDISEVLELKEQVTGTICMYSNNIDNTAGVITNFNNGDLGVDIGGGVTHLDYNDDLVSVSDDNSVIY